MRRVRPRRGLPDAVPAAGAWTTRPAAVRSLLGLHRRAARPGARPTVETTDAARRFFRGQDVVVEPRKLWVGADPGPQGQDHLPGAGPGAGVRRRPGLGRRLAGLWRQDGPAPQVILDAMVEVLMRWSATWQRPTAVVAMPSRRFPTLINSVAAHLATVGRLPLVDALAVTGPPPDADGASAVRATDLLYRTSVRPGVRFDGPVLFVDDTIRTRWTLTVAGSLLAEAGATSVLPLVVHQQP